MVVGLLILDQIVLIKHPGENGKIVTSLGVVVNVYDEYISIRSLSKNTRFWTLSVDHLPELINGEGFNGIKISALTQNGEALYNSAYRYSDTDFKQPMNYADLMKQTALHMSIVDDIHQRHDELKISLKEKDNWLQRMVKYIFRIDT